jgi:hypothetical protein
VFNIPVVNELLELENPPPEIEYDLIVEPCAPAAPLIVNVAVEYPFT